MAHVLGSSPTTTVDAEAAGGSGGGGEGSSAGMVLAGRSDRGATSGGGAVDIEGGMGVVTAVNGVAAAVDAVTVVV